MRVSAIERVGMEGSGIRRRIRRVGEIDSAASGA